MVDSLAADIRYALRTFRKAPLAALTIVGTVALGLGLVTVVFTLYNMLFLRADAVRNPEQLFELRTTPADRDGVWLPFTRSRFEALRNQTSVLTDAAAILRGNSARISGGLVRGDAVSGNFFDVLGAGAALGRALIPSDDDGPGGRPVIVLSDRGWNRLFARDRTAVGTPVHINGVPHEIVGVMPAVFRGLSVVPPDYWAPLAGVATDPGGLEVIARLRHGASPAAAMSVLGGWAAGRTDLARSGGRFTTVRLTHRDGTLELGQFWRMVFAPAFLAFGLVLLIACANVASLLLARGMARQRELGIRLALGASRSRIVRQLLTENVLLASASALCGFVLSRMFLDGALYALSTAMPPELGEQLNFAAPPADWRVAGFLSVGALAATAFFAVVPALHSTRLEPVRTMHGEVARDDRPRRTRHVLIAVQVAASMLLLVGAAVFLRGALHAATADVGVRTSDTLIVPVADESRRAALLGELSNHPLVAATAAGSAGVIGTLPQFTRVEAPAEVEGQPANGAALNYQFVSAGYFSVLAIDLVAGRLFDHAEDTADAGIVLVSEAAARRLWPDTRAVGRVVRLPADPRVQQSPRRLFTVVGVVRDVGPGYGSLQIQNIGVYLPAAPETAGTALILRVHGDPSEARRALLDRLAVADPTLSDISVPRTFVRMQVYLLLVAFCVAVVLGALALGLTLSGVFSVLSYIVAQRSKEIGVRKALGATKRRIARLVLSESLIPVAVGLVAGGTLAAALARYLMSMPLAMLLQGVVNVHDPVAYGASLLVIVTACALAASIPAWRAARLDPIETLRND